MATDPASPSKPKSSIRRFRIGVNVVTQIALLFVIVALINWLSCQNHKQWDRSPSKRYSLGEQTKQVLENLSEDLYITMAFGRGSDVYPYTQRILGLYEKAGKGKLKIRWVDPLRDPAAIAELRNQDPKLIFDQNKILVSKSEKLKGSNDSDEAVADYEVVPEGDMFQRGESTMFRDGSPRPGRVIEYRLERALTSALVAATDESKQAVYIVVNKGLPPKFPDQGDAGTTIKNEVEGRQNLTVKPLALTPTSTVPDDAGVVVLLAPSRDFTGAELKILFRDYWEERKGGLIFLYDPVHHQGLPNLLGYLEKNYGVRIEDDRVLGIRSVGGRNLVSYDVPCAYMPGSPITETLLNQLTTLPGVSSSINTNIIGEADNILTPRTADKKPLMFAIEDFWKEKDYLSDSPTVEPRELNDVTLAVSIERGAGINQDLRLNSSRMVVVGNGNLLDPPYRTLESVEFMLNCVNWTTDREELVSGIDSEAAGNFKIEVGDRPFKKMERMALRIVPGLAFLLGLVVAFFRRR